MKKEQLRDKLIDFQKEIITVSRALRAKEATCQDAEDNLLLELVDILDSFENVFKNLEEKESTFDKSTQRAMKSFKAIYRKVIRILEDRGVEKIEFPDGKAKIGLCKIVETKAVEGIEDGSIISIVRNGYRRGERILRSAEVITVSQVSSASSTS